MKDHHATQQWVCSICDPVEIFHLAEDFENHMYSTDDHKETFTESQLPMLTKLSLLNMPLKFTSCPLCRSSERQDSAYKPLQDHIAEHIHSFALISLPWRDGDEGSEKSRAVAGFAGENTNSDIMSDSGSSDSKIEQSSSPAQAWMSLVNEARRTILMLDNATYHSEFTYLFSGIVETASMMATRAESVVALLTDELNELLNHSLVAQQRIQYIGEMLEDEFTVKVILREGYDDIRNQIDSEHDILVDLFLKIDMTSSIDTSRRAPVEQRELTLQAQLENALVAWPRGNEQFFIPVDVQDRLLTVPCVAKEFERLFPNLAPTERLSYVSRTCSSARKLFAILLGIEKGSSILDFLADGITDSDLPLLNYPKRTANASYTLRAKRQIDSPIPAIENWAWRDIRHFYREQWWLKAPVFDTLGKHHELEDDCVLPFVEDKGNIIGSVNTGSYSDVWGVRIHPAHQTIFKSQVRASSPLVYNLTLG